MSDPGAPRRHTFAWPVFSVAYGPGQHLFVGSGPDLAIWHVPSEQEVFSNSKQLSFINVVAASGDGKHVATASWDDSVVIWDIGESEAKLAADAAQRPGRNAPKSAKSE